MKYFKGKKIGGFYYIHKDSIHRASPNVVLLWSWADAAFRYRHDWTDSYTIIKVKKDCSQISLVECQFFDITDEPLVGDILTFNMNNGTSRITKEPKDPWVYHHKWKMIHKDDCSDNWEAWKKRSEWWETRFPKWASKSKIGKHSYWKKVIDDITDANKCFLVKFGLSGHTEYIGGPNSATLSGYENPETWTPSNDKSYDRAIFVDMTKVYETSPSVAHILPMVKVMEEDVQYAEPMEYSNMAKYMKSKMELFCQILNVHEATSKKFKYGSLDQVCPKIYAQECFKFGGRIGRWDKKLEKIVWQTGEELQFDSHLQKELFDAVSTNDG